MSKILSGILGGVIIAWILTWLKVDQLLIKGAYNLFKLTITREGFYCIFVILGLIFSFVDKD